MTMPLLRDVHHERATPNWTPAVPAPGSQPRDPHERSALAWMREAWRRRRTRILLCELDDRMLKDIGITRAEAGHEAGKPFWLP